MTSKLLATLLLEKGSPVDATLQHRRNLARKEPNPAFGRVLSWIKTRLSSMRLFRRWNWDLRF